MINVLDLTNYSSNTSASGELCDQKFHECPSNGAQLTKNFQLSQLLLDGHCDLKRVIDCLLESSLRKVIKQEVLGFSGSSYTFSSALFPADFVTANADGSAFSGLEVYWNGQRLNYSRIVVSDGYIVSFLDNDGEEMTFDDCDLFFEFTFSTPFKLECEEEETNCGC